MESYQDMMKSKELITINEHTFDLIEPGTLIGFMGLGEAHGITAAYPVWRHKHPFLDFILFVKDDGTPCIDGTRISENSKLFINKEPIVVSIPEKVPQTFPDRIKEMFSKIEKNS